MIHPRTRANPLGRTLLLLALAASAALLAWHGAPSPTPARSESPPESSSDRQPGARTDRVGGRDGASGAADRLTPSGRRSAIAPAPAEGVRARTEGDAYDENGVYWFAAKTPPDGPPIPPEAMTDPLQGLALTVELMWVYRADYDRDGLLDSEDLAWFLDDFHHARPDTDLNRDGLFTPADLVLYLRDYANRQMMQVGAKAYFPRQRGE